MQEVSVERFVEVLNDQRDNEFSVRLNSYGVALMHGALRRMMRHPTVAAEFSNDFKRLADDLVGQCTALLRSMGFTEAELAFLNEGMVV